MSQREIDQYMKSLEVFFVEEAVWKHFIRWMVL